MSTFYDLSAKTADGKEFHFNTLKGKTVLIVNVASKCGFTVQYKGLEDLYQKYKDKNFIVLGFPCNQFGWQEPGEDLEIQSFCSLNYNVTFPVLSKIQVNGQDTHPVYQFLKANAPSSEGSGIMSAALNLSSAIKWNFEKFLVNKDGKVVARHFSATKPEDLQSAIEKLL